MFSLLRPAFDQRAAILLFWSSGGHVGRWLTSGISQCASLLLTDFAFMLHCEEGDMSEHFDKTKVTLPLIRWVDVLAGYYVPYIPFGQQKSTGNWKGFV